MPKKKMKQEELAKMAGMHQVSIAALEKATGTPQVADPNEVEEVRWFKKDALPEPTWEPLKNFIEEKGETLRLQ